MTMIQPTVKLVNEFQILMIIEDGEIIGVQREDVRLNSSWQAIIVNERVAFMRSVKTGKVVSNNAVLMTIAKCVFAMLV